MTPTLYIINNLVALSLLHYARAGLWHNAREMIMNPINYIIWCRRQISISQLGFNLHNIGGVT